MKLAHLPLDKMATISQMTFTKAFSQKKRLAFWFEFHYSLFPKGPNDKESGLVQVMAWRRAGDKPLPEPRLTQLTDAYMQH